MGRIPMEVPDHETYQRHPHRHGPARPVGPRAHRRLRAHQRRAAPGQPDRPGSMRARHPRGAPGAAPAGQLAGRRGDHLPGAPDGRTGAFVSHSLADRLGPGPGLSPLRRPGAPGRRRRRGAERRRLPAALPAGPLPRLGLRAGVRRHAPHGGADPPAAPRDRHVPAAGRRLRHRAGKRFFGQQRLRVPGHGHQPQQPDR